MKAIKYNVGDKVLIKDIDWYNENKDKDGIFHWYTTQIVIIILIKECEDCAVK